MSRHRRRRLEFLGSALALLLVVPSHPLAHEVPPTTIVQAFVKPEGRRLRFLVRVPLISITGGAWPQSTPGVLDLARVEPILRDAASSWIGDRVTFYEEARPLGQPRLVAVRASAPAPGWFDSYEGALAGVTKPSAPGADEVWLDAGFLEALFELDIVSDASRFAIAPRFGRFGPGTTTALRALLPDGSVRAFELEGDPGLIRLDPDRFQTARRFVTLGFGHLVGGLDHLVFLSCLLLPHRRVRQMFGVTLTFAVAHSITLVASASDMAPDGLWFPPLVQTLAAVSILYVAIENIVGARLDRRWIVAFAFGLVHGFGSWLSWRGSLQLAGSHPVASILSFNAGVVLGLMFLVAALIPALALLFRYAGNERVAIVVLSAIALHTGWHAMTARAALLSEYQFRWPAMTPGLVADALRWLMLAVAVAAGMWLKGVLRTAHREKRVLPATRVSERLQ